jgi:hypothetical protein
MKPRRSYFQENPDEGDRFAVWKTKLRIVFRLPSDSCEWDQNPSCVAPAALGDLGYWGKRLASAGETLGITLKAVACGHDGIFIPTGIRWVVERSFSWISSYRRLNTIFERTKEHLMAFIEIAFVSILARRLKRLVIEGVSA